MNERGDMFERLSGELVAAVRAGLTVDEAASRCDVSVHTVRSWLTKGRKDPLGTYGRFASEVDATRQLQSLPDHSQLTREELECLLAEKARAGSVPAMRLWVDLHRHEFEGPAGDEDPFAQFDGKGQP